jgi:hypothetical protein
MKFYDRPCDRRREIMLLDPPSSGTCGVVQTAGVVLLSFASIGNAARATLLSVISLVEEGLVS